jgi:aspartyl-tRNA(Asn)/glutamyl-tRNA(Gln) amidotransferase subunit A
MRTLHELAAALEAGTTSARALVEDCLARIADPDGEGARVFIKVYAEPARMAADAMDLLRRSGRAPGPFAGIPFSLKDLFDVAGEPTPAGSVVLADAPPAAESAPLIRRMFAAGFVPMGRTNMTEFAFSGLGINPHFGTPASPWDRASRRIPGGSSSGAAVSVSDGMAFAALGTDTGGSCRVPAAMCGVVGYKPTARRVPITGVLPLSPSLDSVGPLANSVACCAAVDAVLAGAAPAPLAPLSLSGLRMAIPSNIVLDGLDADVAAAFARALEILETGGAVISEVRFAAMDEIGPAHARGTFAGSEAFAWHRVLLARDGARYDPRIRPRIERGAAMLAADYIDLLAARAAIVARMNAATQDFDVLLMPTCPLVPPPIADLDDEAEYNRVNLLQLRNTTLGNFLDRCAISLPCQRPGEPPVGLMLMGETMGDAKLFRMAAAVEAALAEAL